MKYGALLLEKKEFVILKRFLSLSGYHKDSILQQSVKKLMSKLDSARIYDETEMPKDIIRLNSFFTITSEGGWHKSFQLVVPTDSDIKKNKISILTPMGTSVIGHAENDSILWEFPTGEEFLIITAVKQSKTHLDIDILF